MALVADWGWGRPGARALKAAGFTGVARYLSRDLTKALDRTEVADYRATNPPLAIHAVFEDSAGRALSGFNAGVADAQFAKQQALGLGWDGSGCLYFAVDRDIDMTTQAATVRAYFQGVGTVLGFNHIGGYGEADVIDDLYANRLIKYRWQTTAWSRGRVTATDLFQQLGQVTVASVAVDKNDVRTGDTGAWFGVIAGGAPIVAVNVGRADNEIAACDNAVDGLNPSKFSTQFPYSISLLRQLADVNSGAARNQQVGLVGVGVAQANEALVSLAADVAALDAKVTTLGGVVSVEIDYAQLAAALLAQLATQTGGSGT